MHRRASRVYERPGACWTVVQAASTTAARAGRLGVFLCCRREQDLGHLWQVQGEQQLAQ